MTVKMQKNDFEFVKPLPRNLHVFPAKFDEFSRQSFTFSKLIIFSVKGHEVLKNLSKVKSKTFDFTGENGKFTQDNKERGMTDSLHGMTGLKDLWLAQE